jgi:hypothetical protein
VIVYHKYGSSKIGAGFGVSGRIFVAAECGGGVSRRGVRWWSVAVECGGGVWRRSVVVECGGVGCGGAATQGRQFFMESKYVNNIDEKIFW